MRKRKRLVILMLTLFSFFGLLVMQFYRLQIAEQEKWAQAALKQHYFVLKEPFHRGTFYSNTTLRKGHPEKEQPFVVDIEKFHLFSDPKAIPQEHKKEIVVKLAEILKLNGEEKKDLVRSLLKKTHLRRLAMWLPLETKEEIMKWWGPFYKEHKIAANSLYFVSDYQRSYPFGKLLGQVLHTTQSLKDEKTYQSVPTGGLELYFNEYLQGTMGKRRLMRSPRHHLEMGEVLTSPEDGADIYLTINHYIQAIAEEEVMKGVKKCKAKSGWAVMMNPHTGEILALAQYPFFNPSNYAEHFADPLLKDSVKVKAVSDANEPGSVMKPLNLALALKANQELTAKGEKPLFDIHEKVATSSGHFKGRSKPITDTTFHGYLNGYMAIQKSSNIYMARLIEKLVNRMGAKWYREQLTDVYHIGKRTGIELPSETRGVLPLPGKKHPNGALEWSVSTPYSLAMGYNMQLNTLQILRAHSVIANGGYLVEPTLIRKIVKKGANGEPVVLVDNTSPERVKNFPRVLKADIVEEVARAMKYPTKPGGTSRRADIWGFSEAGKSSTSHKVFNGGYAPKLTIANFVGFAPFKEPQFVLIVTMDEPEWGFINGTKIHHGGYVCAPVFKEIARRTLEYLGTPPDDPYGYPRQDPRFNREKADWIKEAEVLQEMYEKWNNVKK